MRITALLLLVIASVKVQSQQPKLVLPIGHLREVHDISFSNTSRIVITNGDGGSMLWDANSGKFLIAFPSSYVRFSGDDKRMVAQSDSFQALISLEQFDTLAVFRCAETRRAAVFSPDNKTLICYTDSADLLIDAVSGKVLNTIKGYGEIIYSPDGSLAARDNGTTVDVYHSLSGTFFSGIHPKERIRTLQFNRKGDKLLIGSQTLHLYEIATGKALAEYKNEKFSDRIEPIISPSDNFLLTSYNDTTIRLWDLTSGSVLFDFLLNSFIYKTAMSENGSRVVISNYNQAKIFNTENGVLVSKFDPITSPYDMRFVNNGQVILSSASSQVHKNNNKHPQYQLAWDAGTGKALFDRDSHVPFTPDGITIIQQPLDTDSAILVSNSKKTRTLRNFGDIIRKVAFSKDKRRFVTLSGEKDVKLWSMQSGELFSEIKAHTRRTSLHNFSVDGKRFITSDGTRATAWYIDSLKPVLHIPTTGSARFLPDGKRILITEDNSISLADAVSGNILLHVPGIENLFAVFINSSHDLLLTRGFYEKNIIDLQTGKKIQRLHGRSDALFTHDGKRILTSYPTNDYEHADFAIDVVDAYSGYTLYTTAETAPYPIGSPPTINITSNDRAFSMYSVEDELLIWNTDDAKLIARLKEGGYPVYTPSGDTALRFQYKDSSVRLWDITTGRQIAAATMDFVPIKALIYQSNVIVAGKNKITRWNASSDQFLTYTPRHNIKNIQLLEDHNSVVIGCDQSVAVWDYVKDSITFFLDASSKDSKLNRYVEDVTISENGTNIYILFDDMGGNYYDLSTGSVIISDMISVLPHPSKEFIIGITGDNLLQKRDYRTDKLSHNFIAFDSINYLNLVPGGYYSGTQDAAKLLHYVTPQLKVIGFEQLDIRYNRPDKVLEYTGSTDTALILAYRKAWEKRVKKLGIDTSQFNNEYSIPESDIVNRDRISPEVLDKKLAISFNGIDSNYTLASFNIWVNEVPVYGLKGISISNRKLHSFDTTITITLSRGTNRIETSVTSVNGIESYRMPLYVTYTPEIPVKENIRFIGIGLNRFKDDSYNLNWSVKDIRDLCTKLKERYPEIAIDTLFDKDVTRKNILALKENLLQLAEDDKVIIAYSGHGLLSKDLDYFLSTYDINFNKPEKNGLAYDEIESLLDGIRPRKKLMLIDACHSGEIDKEEIDKILAAEKNLDSLGTTTNTDNRSSIIVQKKKLGMGNSFELMQRLFLNVSRGTGATIISAAGGMQYAQERGDLKNGVFTFCIIEAFNTNTSLTVSGLKKIVGNNVVRLTNGLQRPTSRNETNHYDWIVW